MANLKNFPDTIDWLRVQTPNSTSVLEHRVITAQIAEHSTERKAQEEFLANVISEWNGSVYLKTMKVGERYYRNENDILQAKRTVIGRDKDSGNPTQMETTLLANNRIPHPFLRKLTRQKLGYLLGSPFMISAAKKDDEAAKMFIERVKEYTGKNFFKMIKRVACDSIVKKIGWVQAYYNEEGNLRFRRAEPENVIPLWRDSDHTILDAVIYRYFVEVYTGPEKNIETYVDYYNREGVWHYKLDDKSGKLVRIGDPNNPPDGHFAIRRWRGRENGVDLGWDEIPLTWGKIPFIPFKYDADELGLLQLVKAMIDDYDTRKSQLSNNIEDFPNSITVVQNYDGEDKEEWVHNKNVYRTMFVTGDGDAKVLDTPLNIKEINEYLDKTKADIYESGSGVNTSNKDIRDTSGVALKYLYADLDLDCKDWGTELEWSLMELFWFIQQDVLARYGEDYTDTQYGINFKIDIIINESEIIQNCFQSVGVISERTIAENHPWVQNVEKELSDLHGELEEELQMKEDYGQGPANPAETKKATMGQG